mgnify:CR=1 FL=1
MIYYTGDIHGDPYEVIQFCDSKKLTEQDTLVLLGDVGANYYRNRRDTEMKRVLAAVKPTMLCIHGNHEIRPASIPSYRTKQWNGGTVWVEEAFPRLLFAMDGEIFDLEVSDIWSSAELTAWTNSTGWPEVTAGGRMSSLPRRSRTRLSRRWTPAGGR